MSRVTGGRVLWRLAWRDAAIERRRHGLIVALLAVAVAAAVAVGVGGRTAEVSAQERDAAQFGAAQLRISLYRSAVPYAQLPAELRAEVDARFGGPVDERTAADVEAALADVVPDADVTRLDERFTTVADGGVQVLVGDPSHPLLEGRLVGDLDTMLRPGEVLASPGFLDQIDAEVGDNVRIGVLGTVTIVGRAADPLRRSAPLVVTRHTPDGTVAPSDHDALHHEWYVGLDASSDDLAIGSDLRSLLEPPSASNAGAPPPHNASVNVRSPDPGLATGVLHASERFAVFGLVVALVSLVQVGFVAAATFATGTRRRVREFGMLAASAGATPGQLRGLVLRQAIVLGAVGGGAGVLFGLAAVTLGLPVVEAFADRPLDGLDLRTFDLLAPPLMAVAATLVAAWVPARTVARVPLTSALAGRIPLRRVRRRVAPTSLVVALAGAALIVAATQLQPGGWVGAETSSYLAVRGWFSPAAASLLRGVGVVLGVGLLLGGGAGLASPLLQMGSRLAAGRSLPTRLAMRDSGRQRTRSAATVSATLAVLTVPVFAGVLIASDAQQQRQRADAVRDDVAVVSGPAYLEQRLSPTDDMLDVARAWLPPVEAEVRVPVVADGMAADQVWLMGASGEGPDDVAQGPDARPPASPIFLGGAVVASDELLALAGIDRTDAVVIARPAEFGGVPDPLPETGLLAVERDGRAPATTDTGALEVAVLASPRLGWQLPPLLIPESIAAEVPGLDPVGELVVLDLDGPVDLATARAAGDAAGEAPLPFSIQTSPPESPPRVLTGFAIAGGAATAIALVIAALTAALAATESDRDLRTMRAVGADPRLRARFRARQVAYHTVLAALLAVPIGLLLTAAVRVATDIGGPFVVPWLAIAALVILVPALVALPFRLLSRPQVTPPIPRRPT